MDFDEEAEDAFAEDDVYADEYIEELENIDERSSDYGGEDADESRGEGGESERSAEEEISIENQGREETDEEAEDEYELQREFARSRKRKGNSSRWADAENTDTVDRILDEDQKKGRTRGVGRRRKRRDGLPKHLEGLMGTANILYSKKEYDSALKILKSIVKEAPKAIAPYHTIGLIYEARDDHRRALDFYMIASLLDRSDADLWKSNAARSIRLNNTEQAVFCYSMALKVTKPKYKDEKLLETLAHLREERGDIRKAAGLYERLLNLRPKDQGLIGKVVALYESIALPDRAAKALFKYVEDAIEKNGIEAVQSSMVEKLVERLLKLKKYVEAGALLSRYSLLCANDPVKFPLELRVRLAICNVRLGSAKVEEELKSARSLLANKLYLFKDLYFGLGDALLDTGHPELAISVYDELAADDDRDHMLALRRGTAHRENGQLAEARKHLHRALELKPGMVEASMVLVELYQQSGETEKISEVLNNIEGTVKQKSDAKAAAEETVKRILEFAQNYEESDLHRYVETLLPLMEAACNLPRRNARDASTVGVLDQEAARPNDGGPSDENTDGEWLFRFEERKSGKKKTERYGFSMRDVGIAIRSVLSSEQYLAVLEKFWRAMCKVERDEEAGSIITKLVYLKNVGDTDLILRLRLLGLAASIRGHQLMHAQDELSSLCMEQPENPTYWYALATLVDQAKQDKERRLTKATFKFAIRIYAKHPDAVPCILAAGSWFFESGTYRSAVALWLRAYMLEPEEPVICLLLAVVYLHMVQARRTLRKAECMMKALTFLGEYRRLRQNIIVESKAEILYNFARFYHFCNLLHVAAPLYEQVLKLDMAGAAKDLRRDAAYNLAILYKSKGSILNANRVLWSCLEF